MILPCIIFFFYIGFDLSSWLWTSPEYNCKVKTAKRYLPRWMFVSHFVSTSSQGSPWVQHMPILRIIVSWAFSTNEKVWKLSVSTRALSCQRRRTVKPCILQEDASSYFNLKSFSCQVQQEVFLTLVLSVIKLYDAVRLFHFYVIHYFCLSLIG